MNFREIEKEVDDVVLMYIKDSCLEERFDRREIVCLGPGRFGTVYQSRLIYKKMLNEEKYRKLVREYYLRVVQPSLVEKKAKTTKKRAKRELGKHITQEEFLQTLFRENFEHRKGEKDKQGRRINMNTFLANIDVTLKTIDSKAVANSFEKMLAKVKKYGYFTPNMFISHKSFAKELLTLLGVIVLDFDLDKVNKVMTKEEVFRYIKKKLKVEPAMIWDTKTLGNYQVAILIEPMAATPKAVHLYEQVVKEMIYKLGDMVDEACANANHLFSIGQNNKRKKRVIRKYNDNIYSINEFRWLLHERDERRKKQADSSSVIDFTKEAVRRNEAIQALYNGDVSWRNNACFTLALVMRFLGESEQECENYILSVWVPIVKDKGDHIFTTAEALKCIQHAYSGKYKNFHSNWVETVTGIECNLRGFFRGYSPYINQGIYVTDTEKRVLAFLKEQDGSFVGTQEDLVGLLGVTKRTLERVLPKLRKEGHIAYETKRGNGTRTTAYSLVEQMEIPVIQAEGFKTFDEQMMHLAELEHIMQEMTC